MFCRKNDNSSYERIIYCYIITLYVACKNYYYFPNFRPENEPWSLTVRSFVRFYAWAPIGKISGEGTNTYVDQKKKKSRKNKLGLIKFYSI